MCEMMANRWTKHSITQASPPDPLIDFIQLIPSVDAIRIELFKAHRHMARPRLAILICYNNNHDAVVVHVMHLAMYRQTAYLEFHQYWVHFPRYDCIFASTFNLLDLQFEIGPELPEIA